MFIPSENRRTKEVARIGNNRARVLARKHFRYCDIEIALCF